MEKIRILIYGDSNTYGFDAENCGRFDENTRWTKVCQKLLGDRYEIIEEGLIGRTTCHDSMDAELAEAPYVNGLRYISPCVLSHLPLDAICVKLGSNDFMAAPENTPEMIAEDAAKVLRRARELAEKKFPERKCRYVLMAPLESTEDALFGPFADSFSKDIIEKGRHASAAYERIAEREGFMFFDANRYARCGKFDGTHLDAENHSKMARAVSQWLTENIGLTGKSFG